MHMESLLLLKRQFKNKKQMEEICFDVASILDSSAGYRKKRSHNRMIGSHWAWKHISLK